MRVRFWGTRGSFPKPGPTTLRYGGNTSCVEVRADDGTLVVLDCGTGAHALGLELAVSGRPVRGNLLFTHTHWDHIQGFPFFEPLFAPGSEWEIFAPGGRGRELEVALSGQMAYEYSPITLDSLDAKIQFHDLFEGVFEIGGVRITTQYLNHPALTLGYRLEVDGATVVYATDHEPYSLHPLGASAGTPPIHREDRRHVSLLEGADLVVHDAQYVLDEFPDKAGWGHTPVERAVDYAILAGAKRLALFHHDPDRSDDAVDRIVDLARQRAAAAEFEPEVFSAAEGRVLELSGERGREQAALAAETSALLPRALRGEPATALVVDDDPNMLRLLEAALQPEGVRVITAREGGSALMLARRERPAIVLLDLNLPGCEGLKLCRMLRAEQDAQLKQAPILVLTGAKLGEKDLVEAFGAGVTDYLTKPVKPTLVRSRVRGWLQRVAAA